MSDIYKVEVQYGIKTLKRTVWRITWKSHDLFDAVGEYMNVFDADDTFLSMLVMTGGTYEFTNERPAPKQWWEFWK